MAASFSSLRLPQRRIVFREGDFVSPSNFYPACLWTAADRTNIPPPRFSELEVPPTNDPLPPPSAGHVEAIEARVAIPALSPDDGLTLLCRPVQEVESLVRQPRADQAPAADAYTCLGPAVMVARFEGPRICPSLQSYTLVGCGEDPGCAVPEWDVRTSPPPWWATACPP